MASKPDIMKQASTSWDKYKDKPTEDALSQLYEDTQEDSKIRRRWYWTSIKTKRWTSLSVRFLAVLLLLVGTALPLLAGLSNEAATRLTCTQIAVTLLAIAGLLQVADKVFGWSTGWMRYINTVTAMESATSAFEIEWSKYLISKSAPLELSDVQTLFALSEGLKRELIKLQSEETKSWITEFNAGLSLLDSVIKAQREETQKQLDALRTTVSNAQAAAKAEEKAKADAAAAAANAEAKAKQAGTIDVTFIYKSGPRLLRVSLDGGTPEEFLGSSWSRANIPPGLHTVVAQALTDPKESAQKSVLVEPGAIAKIEINFQT
jgi:septum formation inhibitor MinC